MGEIKDMRGMRFDKLYVIKEDTTQTFNDRYIHWICKCDCGNITSVKSDNLRSGNTKSCGCMRGQYFKTAAHKNSIKNRIENGVQVGCSQCGESKHFSKGLCEKCYKRKYYFERKKSVILV